jgi:hypothetical protein
MLPESESAKQEYIEMRDYRNRWRQDQLRSLKGDLDDFGAYVMAHVAIDAEMAGLRESVDFAQAEGILTAEMIPAAEAAIAWGTELKRLIDAALAGRKS